MTMKHYAFNGQINYIASRVSTSSLYLELRLFLMTKNYTSFHEFSASAITSSSNLFILFRKFIK